MINLPPIPREGDCIVFSHFAPMEFISLSYSVNPDGIMGKAHFSENAFMLYSINKNHSCWILKEGGVFENIQLFDNEDDGYLRLLPCNNHNTRLINSLGKEKYEYKSPSEIIPILSQIQFLNVGKFTK